MDKLHLWLWQTEAVKLFPRLQSTVM